MVDLVVWRDSGVPDQSFGKAGRIDMFIVGRDPDTGRFILGTKGLFGSDKGLIGFGSTQYDDAAAAQAAAEDELVRILAELDAVTADLRAG